MSKPRSPELRQRKVARVLFDEAHHEAWTIRPEVARTMQPKHFEDSSYARAAALLGDRDFAVAANAGSALTAELLTQTDVLVIAHPSAPKWERTVDSPQPPRFSADELDAVEAWVRAGGGLVVLGECEEDMYETNLNDLLGRFGLQLENETVSDYVRFHQAPTWVLADLDHAATPGVDVLARVDEACFYRAGSLSSGNGARIVARSSEHAEPAAAPLLAVSEPGDGRVVVAADSDLFGDDCIGELDHTALWLNLLYWAGQPAFRETEPAIHSAAAADPHWATLKEHVAVLRLTQQPDGSIDLSRHDADGLGAHVDAIITAIEGLGPHFPHQADHLAATVDDLRRWAAAGFGRPDFGPSLELFRPDLHRADGVEHLVVFPMYKQNASRDTCFEALIVRVPWPAWLAELERTYDNAKFVPVTLVDHTDGYDSECAVLFPETVAVDGPPANHFGAIFCDREAGRFRASSAAAAEILRLDLTPDAAALLQSDALCRDSFVLWDLDPRPHPQPRRPAVRPVHDPPAHAVLDVLAGGAALRSRRLRGGGQARGRRGSPFARHVQYAILFDRLLPLSRHRDARAQLRRPRRPAAVRLPAPHRRGALDRQPPAASTGTASPTASAGCASASRPSTVTASTCPRIAHWIAAHELVAEFVAPAIGSRWTPAGRAAAAWATRASRRPGWTPCATTSSRSTSSTRRCARSSPRQESARGSRDRRGVRSPARRRLRVSDNYAGVHPDVLAAVAEANDGPGAAYGDDPLDRARAGALPGSTSATTRRLPGVQRHRPPTCCRTARPSRGATRR